MLFERPWEVHQRAGGRVLNGERALGLGTFEEAAGAPQPAEPTLVAHDDTDTGTGASSVEGCAAAGEAAHMPARSTGIIGRLVRTWVTRPPPALELVFALAMVQ